MARTKNGVFVFNFDGVLDSTELDVQYHNLIAFINKLEHHVVCVVSSDPQAKVKMDAWGLHVDAIRAGANHEWVGLYEDQWGETMTKPLMIADMLKSLDLEPNHRVFFYDAHFNRIYI